MAVTLVDLTFKITDLIGATFNARRTRIWIESNVDGNVIIDADGNQIHLGNGLPDSQMDGYIDSTGAGQFTGLVATNSATNPTAFQYRVTIEYDLNLPAQTNPQGKKSRWSSGWFSLTANADLADVAAEAYVPPTWQSSFTASMQAIADDAASSEAAASASASAAAASAAQAADIIVTDLGTTDAQTAFLIENPSDTRTALTASYATELERAGSPLQTSADKFYRAQKMDLAREIDPASLTVANFNTALAAIASAGGGEVRVRRDNWAALTGATGVALTGTNSPIHIKGEEGAVLDMTGITASIAMKLGGSATATSAALGADVSKGADSITCATVAAAVVPGSIIRLTSTDLFETLQNLVKGELAEVLSVSGSTITLKSGLWDSYTAATTTVTLMQMPRVSMEGLTLLWDEDAQTGLQVTCAREAALGGLVGEGARATLFQFDSVFGGTADNLHGRDFWFSGGTSCYGLQVGSSQHITEIGLDLRGGRHGISHGGTYPTRDVQTLGGTFDSYHPAALPAFDYHGNCEDVSILGATILNGLGSSASNLHVGAGARIKGITREAVEIGPARSCDYVKIENVDIESKATFDGVRYTPRNGANATTLGLFKVDATIRAGAAGVRLTPSAATHTGATIDRVVLRGDVLAGGSSSAVEIGKATAAYVAINQIEFDGRFRAPAQDAVDLAGTSTGPAKFRGDYQTDGNGCRAIDCRMFGAVRILPGTTLKGTNSPFRSLFQNTGVLDLTDTVIDGAFAAAFDASSGPTEVMQSNVRRINGAGAPLLPARHFTRINEAGKVVTSGTAAPTAGSWNVGDRCENSAPAVGSAKAWVCTVAGTPGTWVSEGNL